MKKIKSLFVLMTVLLLCTKVFADDNDEARAAFQKGKTLFSQEKYSEAASSFQKSYDLRPSWKILLNIGQCNAAAKDYGRALEAFEAYLAQGGDDVPLDIRDEIIAEIRIMKELVGYLQSKAPDGSELIINGVIRERYPLPGPVLVSAGVNHDVKILKDGKILLQRTIRINSGRTMELHAVDESPLPIENNTTDAQNHNKTNIINADKNTRSAIDQRKKLYSRPLRIAGWATTGVGLGLLVGGIVTGAMVLSLHNEYTSDECNTGCEDHSYRIRNLQVSTNVLVGEGAGVTCIGAAILIYSYLKQKKNARKVSFLPSFQPDNLTFTISYIF